MIKISGLFGFLLAVALLFTSCSKKENTEVDNETQSVYDHAIVDQEFLTAFSLAFQSAYATKGTGSGNKDTLITCDTLSYTGGDTLTFSPNPTFSLNLSNTSCGVFGQDKKSRSGHLFVRLTGKLTQPGSQLIIKLGGNYKADGLAYSCDSLVARVEENNALVTTFQVSLTGGLCKAGQSNIQFNFNRTISIYPKGTDGVSEPVAYIYGSSSGKNRQGTNFSTTISQIRPLVKRKSCRYIESGVMELTPAGFKKRSVDFGNGSCDDLATFTVNENTVTFKLK